MRVGRVFLVGAGPGSVDLLTLKAARLLQSAQVVVHDRLVQPEVLALPPATAELIDMGKPVGRHESRQDEINELLVQKARAGRIVVRLKGGDPFVFGRGGEEAEYLAAHGVAYEVVPGVSSSLAAPLAAGIPVTHRAAASSVTIATGHQCDGREALDWAALARLDTLVFLMAVHNAGCIASRLMEHGRPATTPAAMIQTAFWPSQRVVTGVLGTIEAVVKESGIRPPATLVIGDVVALRDVLRFGEPRTPGD
ncbi:MAG: uroporphyrinogen-III C-methyltransferase [Bacteroidales bacterium]